MKTIVGIVVAALLAAGCSGAVDVGGGDASPGDDRDASDGGACVLPPLESICTPELACSGGFYRCFDDAGKLDGLLTFFCPCDGGP